MAKSFNISLTTEPGILLEKVKKSAAENGFDFNGKTSSGRFAGKRAKGEYKISGKTVNITITEKPWYAPWSKVESTIREFFA